MRSSVFSGVEDKLGHLIETLYNGRAGEPISFDPRSNPYAAALARHQGRARADARRAPTDLSAIARQRQASSSHRRAA
jgi:hypothetical protein